VLVPQESVKPKGVLGPYQNPGCGKNFMHDKCKRERREQAASNGSSIPIFNPALVPATATVPAQTLAPVPIAAVITNQPSPAFVLL